MRRVLIVTTRLPPQICGIGTFSWQLERHWPGDKSEHRFLVVDGAAESASNLNYSRISEFGHSWQTLGHALNEAGPVDVLLHYAGRGYHRYGCPIGLPSIFRKWKTKVPDGRLIVFFHELPAHFPITSRHYWLNLCSRAIARKLAISADLIITNTDEHVRMLKQITKRDDICSLPVGSNIKNTTKGEQRGSTEFVIFGLPFSRWQTLNSFDQHIRAWEASGILTKLHLVGPADTKFDPRSEALIRSYRQPAAVVRHGEIPADKVSRLLSESRFALTTANEFTWNKSTTLMAYFSHGCAVVAEPGSNREPLLWTIKPEEVASLALDEIQSRVDSARRWYNANADWNVLARKISELIANLPRRVA